MEETLVSESPFKKVLAGSKTNSERKRYIDASAVQKAINQAPYAQWRLILALCRFAGLRRPSEMLDLRWQDVDSE